jgi:hypothetical protein
MVITDPTSRVFVRVKVPPTDPTFVPVQNIVASALIVALLPAAERLPPTVAFEVLPLPVLSSPLFPGPAADTDAGAKAATISIVAEASQPALRMKEPRRARRAVRGAFMWVPELRGDG